MECAAGDYVIVGCLHARNFQRGSCHDCKAACLGAWSVFSSAVSRFQAFCSRRLSQVLATQQFGNNV
jgi:hypothetical protein